MGDPRGKGRSLLSGNDMKHLESPAGLHMWILWALTIRKDFSVEAAGTQVGTAQVECDWEGQRKKKNSARDRTQ